MSDGEAAPRKAIRKPRKKKFKKDPNAPKRPMTGYFLFMQTVREKIKADNPEFKVTQISKAVGQQWNSLEDEKKQTFLDEAAEKKEVYKKKYEEYLKSDEKREYDEAKKEWKKEIKAKEKRAKMKARAKAQQQQARARAKAQQEVDDYDDDEEDEEEDEYEMVSDE